MNTHTSRGHGVMGCLQKHGPYSQRAKPRAGDCHAGRQVLISPWLRVQISPSPQGKKRLENKANVPLRSEWHIAFRWLTRVPEVPCLVVHSGGRRPDHARPCLRCNSRVRPCSAIAPLSPLSAGLMKSHSGIWRSIPVVSGGKLLHVVRHVPGS
jgi:hypothetical protein